MLERILDWLFEYQEIRDGCEAGTRIDGPVYLKRYFLVKNDFDADRTAGLQRSPRFSLTIHRGNSGGGQLYLHHILRSDADRELHDHPWPFAALMLWRGYVEETEERCELPGCTCVAPCCLKTPLRRKWPGMVLIRGAAHRHRIHLAGGPAWSLVFTGRKRRSWGFWRDGAFIPWRLFVARKCEDQEVRRA